MNLEVGQILSLRIRFNNAGVISGTKHPYLIVDVNEEFGFVEIAQLDSLSEKKRYKAVMRSNKVIFQGDPIETVIDKDSYVQLDNTLRIEYFDGLIHYRRQTDKLSSVKLKEILLAYQKYHERYEIDENKNVYMNKAEILALNS